MRDIKALMIKQRNLRKIVEKRKKDKIDEIESVKLVRKLKRNQRILVKMNAGFVRFRFKHILTKKKLYEKNVDQNTFV